MNSTRTMPKTYFARKTHDPSPVLGKKLSALVKMFTAAPREPVLRITNTLTPKVIPVSPAHATLAKLVKGKHMDSTHPSVVDLTPVLAHVTEKLVKDREELLAGLRDNSRDFTRQNELLHHIHAAIRLVDVVTGKIAEPNNTTNGTRSKSPIPANALKAAMASVDGMDDATEDPRTNGALLKQAVDMGLIERAMHD